MKRTTQEVEIEGRRVVLSNVEKALFPTGFTKGQVIDFYVRISDYVLPHLAARPVTLKRYPNGVTEKHFYEKDAPKQTPDWVRTYPVPRRTREADINYIIIDDLPTLVWCANTASLELHPFLHRVPDIDVPTAVVFDLDPGEGADVLTCAEVSFLLKSKLEERGLESFAKVSGSKGIQVYVPLNTRVSYSETQTFAHGLAEELEREHPALIVSAMAKALRTKKVFIDWSQNSDFKTTVAPYSLRAKSATPFVSLPVRWDELQHARDTRDTRGLYFEPEAAIARVQKLGDLYAPVLTLKQKLRHPVAGTHHAALPDAKIAYVEPMRAQLAASLPEGDGWEYEIKFDGYRALALKKGGEVALLSRNNRVLNRRFSKITEALEALPEGTMLDGEVVALDSAGRPKFNALQHGGATHGAIVYYVFDLLVHRGKSLLHLPLNRRRELLATLDFAKFRDAVRISESLHAPVPELIAAAREQGLEGLVAKRLNSIYEPGARSGAWVKFKVNQSQELVIGGYIPGRFAFDSLLVGYYEGRKLIFNAKVKNGFVPRVRDEVFARMQPLLTDTCPFGNLPEPKNARRGEALTAELMKKCRWVKPKLVAQVEFTEWTDADHLRHSRFAGLRDDKDPRSVVRERLG